MMHGQTKIKFTYYCVHARSTVKLFPVFYGTCKFNAIDNNTTISPSVHLVRFSARAIEFSVVRNVQNLSSVHPTEDLPCWKCGGDVELTNALHLMPR